MNEVSIRRFRRIGISTVIAVYCLILIGAIVRASGAGMGCPDWPTCFGHWVPPTQESQLPPDYHEIYADLGYAETEFNPVKTWTEYLNRLAGVTIGILMMLTVFFAVPYLKRDRPVFYTALAALCLVIFQGWLGAVVVSSHLHPVMITAHMLLALTIVALLIFAVVRSQKDYFMRLSFLTFNHTLKWLLLGAVGLTMIQIILGAQVREAVDSIAKVHDYQHRELWQGQLPWVFYVHRACALLLLCVNLGLIWRLLRQLPQNHFLFRLTLPLGFLILLAVASGIAMERLGIPPPIQPTHLLIANLIFGSQFLLLVALHYCRGESDFKELASEDKESSVLD